MSLRLVFQREDLQQVRFAAGADPMWELVLSLHLAQTRGVPARFAPWSAEFTARARRDGGVPEWMARLCTLVPPRGSFPDFLTPPQTVPDVDAGCEAMVATPQRRVRRDIAAAFGTRAAPSWVRALASGDRHEVGRLTAAVRQGHSTLVTPWWCEIERTVTTDRARRAQVLTGAGVGTVLATLPGVVSWDGRVLETRYPKRRTVDLAGRGLVLVPSYFCWGAPVTFVDPELPPVLIYPAGDAGSPRASESAPPRRLVALLGRTRAHCLWSLVIPRSTSALAHAAGIGVAAASKHATVLRDAGLVRSARHGAEVLHQVTGLGSALLSEHAA